MEQSSLLKQAYVAIEKLQARIAALEQEKRAPIAVIGMGLRFPGDANTPQQFWELLREGVDAITETPPDRWDVEAFYNPDPDVPGTVASRWAGHVRDVDLFDPAFFGIAPREAVSMDPQQRLLLEVAWEALENAGLAADRLENTNTGVFVGITAEDYVHVQLHHLGLEGIDAYYASGVARSVAAGRLAYLLGLKGPAITLDTACSSSLVAVHLAVQSLRNGESTLALAGGVNLMLSVENAVALSKYHMMSPDGRCKPFDASADGFVRAEGCGIVVLKRLSDALADGDTILAVIRGTAINQDGASTGLTAPNGPSQEAVIRAALADAGVKPHEIGFVETHGTGTSLGDPIEAQALGAVLGEGRPADQPVMIGSVKSNIGHLESAAGIAGLIKAILVLQHRAVPPQVNLTELSPYIPWERLPLVIPIELTPFEPVSGRRLAGVSAFGFSGTNCHVILEEAPEIERINNSVDRTHHLLALSAKSAEALRQRALQITEFLSENEQVELADVAHTLNVGRAHFNHRLTVMAATPDEAGKRLQAFAEGREVPGISSGILETTDRPRIAFLFTGQGAQYVGMGRVLYDTQPTFRAALDACDAVLRSFLPQPLLSVIYPQEGQSSPIDHTTYTQPALFAIEYALAQLWQSWGIEPHAVLGHSVGEYVAACLAGVFSLEDGLRLIAERGRLMGALPAGGAMAAAFADEQTVGDIIRVFGDAVTIATINGPENTVISGSEAAVVEAMEALKAQGIKSRRLNVSHAFHSALMEPMLPEFEQVLANVALHRPRLRLAANVTGTFITDEVAHPDYWLRQARGAVRFADCVQSLYDAGYRVFLEIGPNPTLSAMAQRIVPGGNWLASLRQDKDDWATLLTTLGSLYTLGAGPDWAAFDRDYARRRISLPTYPFQRQRYWVKKKPQSARISAARTGVHPLLGERLRSPLKTVQFENVLTPTAFSFLNDHRIHNMPVLPGTAYMEMALAAAESVVGQGFVENMGIYEALVVPDDEQREVQFVLEPGSAGRYLFQLFSQQDGEWKLHASGEIVPGQPAPEPAEPVGVRQSRLPSENSADQHYARLSSRGLDFGSSLHGVQRQWRGDGEALSLVKLPDVIAAEVDQYLVHPSVLDACLQSLAGAMPDALAETDIYLPVGIDRLVQYGPLPPEVYSYARVRPGAMDDTFEGMIQVSDADDHLLVEISGIRLQRASQALLGRLGQTGVHDWLYQIAWEAAPLAESSSLMSPTAIQAKLAPLVDASKVEYGQNRYRELSPWIDALCADYVIHALQKLGWQPVVGERFDLDELGNRLGILAQHRRLLGRLFAILAADGFVRQDAGAWVVIQPMETLDAEALHRRAEELLESFPEFSAELTFAQRCGDQLAEALTGIADPLQLLFPDGSFALTDMLYQESPGALAYNALVREAVSSIVAVLPEHRKLRILEIGAGTGGTTSFVVPHLPADRIESYTFTDISSFFANRAAERFADFRFMRYEVLNIEDDPQQQGFEPGQVDLIIAANVIHATADLRTTLRHVQQLLAPGGMLILLEMIRPERWVDLSFGLTDGWWRFVDADVRPEYPLISQQSWLDLLTEVGFSEAASVPPAADGELPEEAILIARFETPTNWLIFADGQGIGAQLAAVLESGGDRCVLVDPGESYAAFPGRFEINPASADGYRRLMAEQRWDQVVYLWGLHAALAPDEEAIALNSVESTLAGSALYLTQAMLAHPARLWLVTRGAHAVDERPNDAAQAVLWGLGKVIALEHPELDPVCLDLDPADFDPQVVAALLRAPDGEDHIALRDGTRYVMRLARCPVSLPEAEESAWQLVVSERGVIDNLTFVPLARRQPGPNEVEIRVRATGLNFKDVLNVMGMYPGDPGPLGGECAGEILAVGSEVEGLHAGDEVLALASGSFSSHVVTNAELVVAKPARLTFEQAATVPIPFITAYYCLHHLGEMRPGDRVLIHAAAGGVGLAAVQLAQRVGAEIFATAGSPEKRAFLESIGVQHVMDSRTLEFADTILNLTDGQGVDLILNSLADEFVPASVSVLAQGGRFLEIGKRGILSEAEFARQRPDATYAIIDWTPTAIDNPGLIRSILVTILDWIEEGTLNPLPVQVFSLEAASEAFRFMAQAKHIGKIALSHYPAGAVRSDATYLITGGLSGLGLLVARWLADKGARHLALMGRRAPSAEAGETIDSLRSMGVQVEVVQGDVSVEADVRQVLAHIEAVMPPLRGIIHSAGALADAALIQQSWEHFATVFAAKVDGTWLLHRLTYGLPLDFFVMFSSVASLIGSRGQANHAAANSFMDALAYQRRAAGLPGLSINWGAWGEVGAAVEHGVSERVSAQGIGVIPPDEGLRILEGLLRDAPAQVGVSPIDWPLFLRQFKAPLFAAFAEAEAELPASGGIKQLSGSETRTILDQLQKVTPAKRRDLLTEFVREQVALVLGVDSPDSIDEHTPLNSMGLDSLMAVELRNRLGSGLELARTLPATLVFDYPTVTAITQFLLQDVLALDMESAADSPAPIAIEESGDSMLNLLDTFESLSDKEIERLFAERMSGGDADEEGFDDE